MGGSIMKAAHLRTGEPPVISVVIPAFNAAATLGEQLESLSRNVIDEPWEVIVADNGSTDETVRVAESWMDRLPLRVVDASLRRGASAARNVGAAAAGSSNIAFCDADDWVDEDWLRTVLFALRADAFVAIGLRWNASPSRRHPPEWRTHTMHDTWILPGFTACGSGHMAVRTSVFRAVGGFDEELLAGEDLDLCCRIQLAGFPLTPHPEVMVTYRARDGLIGAFRQMYIWEACRGALTHKYALVREVIEGARSETAGTAVGALTTDPAPDTSPGRRAGRRWLTAPITMARRLSRIVAESQGSPPELWRRIESGATHAAFEAVERSARWLARRRTRVDVTRPQLDPALAGAYVERQRRSAPSGSIE